MVRFSIILLSAVTAFASGNYTEKEGQVVVKTADFFEIDKRGGWRVDSTKEGAFQKKYIESEGEFDSKFVIKYKVEFKTTGKFYCLIRSWASNPTNNGCFITLGQKIPDNPGYHAVYFPKADTWNWYSKASTLDFKHTDLLYFNIKKTGVYMLTLYVREIGAKIDVVVFKKEPIPPDIWGLSPTYASGELTVNRQEGPKFSPILIIISIIILLLITIIVLALILRKRREKSIGKPTHQVVDQVKKYIEENYRNPITLNEIAKAANLSKSHLRFIFRTHMNTTVSKYLQEFRLNKAKGILENRPEENISAVAFDCGFENASHFTTAFKNHFGIPPSNLKSRK
jgi:AraC-like DNA-binding protein